MTPPITAGSPPAIAQVAALLARSRAAPSGAGDAPGCTIVTPRPPDTAVLRAGVVGRPHGLDGSFRVAQARPELLSLGAKVTVAGAEREIVRRAGTDDSPIVRLEGVDGRDALEPQRGEGVVGPRAGD